MPNRLIKESICSSDNLNELSSVEEVFFYRLIVNCDDYGICDARPSILRAKCFPLRLSQVQESDIQKWLQSLKSKNLLELYYCDSKPYLKMTSWAKHQQIRAKKSKYPMPDSNGNQLISDDSKCPRNPIQSNTIQSNTVEQELDDACSKIPYKEIIDYLNEKADKKFTDKAQATRKHISARWAEGHGLDDFKRAVDNMVARWKGNPEKEMYLRPSTLFNGEKFEGYINLSPVASVSPTASPQANNNYVTPADYADFDDDGEGECDDD